MVATKHHNPLLQEMASPFQKSCLKRRCFHPFRIIWARSVVSKLTFNILYKLYNSIVAAAAAAAAKSLQLCPTLCDPIDSSPPGSSVPGILQARTLEWVAISFCNAWKWKVKVIVPTDKYQLREMKFRFLFKHDATSLALRSLICLWNATAKAALPPKWERSWSEQTKAEDSVYKGGTPKSLWAEWMPFRLSWLSPEHWLFLSIKLQGTARATASQVIWGLAPPLQALFK